MLPGLPAGSAAALLPLRQDLSFAACYPAPLRCRKENNGNDPTVNLIGKSGGWATGGGAGGTSGGEDVSSGKQPERAIPAQPAPAWGGAGLPEERKKQVGASCLQLHCARALRSASQLHARAGAATCCSLAASVTSCCACSEPAVPDLRVRPPLRATRWRWRRSTSTPFTRALGGTRMMTTPGGARGTPMSAATLVRAAPGAASCARLLGAPQLWRHLLQLFHTGLGASGSMLVSAAGPAAAGRGARAAACSSPRVSIAEEAFCWQGPLSSCPATCTACLQARRPMGPLTAVGTTTDPAARMRGLIPSTTCGRRRTAMATSAGALRVRGFAWRGRCRLCLQRCAATCSTHISPAGSCCYVYRRDG